MNDVERNRKREMPSSQEYFLVLYNICLASDLEPLKGHTFVFILPSKWQCEYVAKLKKYF